MLKKQLPVMLGISAIKGLQYFVDESIEVELSNIRVGYGLEIANDDVDAVRFIISITFRTKDEDKTFASSKTSTIFKVKDLPNYLSNNGEELDLPQESMDVMFSIAFTHARALHAQHTNGTVHEEIIVPIVDPGSLLKNLLRINDEGIGDSK
jgi:hypothetical protein